MCVIIHRKPGVTIPHDKLVSACMVNSEGMGIVSVDRGKFYLRRFFWESGNKPDVLAKHLEELKDLEVYVHLRYRTKGDSDPSNVHPFTVLKQKKHGMDLQFMHNGTLSDYGTDSDCDSKDFVKTFVTPLAERLIPAIGPEALTTDPIFNSILSKFAGGSSVFLLADSFGNHTIVNKKRGYDFDGWWASNEYSFDRYHREPKTTSYGYGYGYHGTTYERSTVQEVKKPTLVAIPTPVAIDTPKPATAPFNDEIPWEETKTVENPMNAMFPDRQTFVEVTGISSLSEACSLSNESIRDLVDDEPEMAALLIIDLLKELYDRDREYDDRSDYERIAS